jgi:rhamnosyltransferase
MKNILFFVHYNKYDLLLDYVLYLLEHIKQLYNRIIFISNSKIPDSRKDLLSPLCHSIIIRENKGFDFGAWKEALIKEGWDKLSGYDTLTLMNDTCFGPMFDLEAVYIHMNNQKTDFWGLTNHRKTRNYKLSNYKLIPEHIQSYLMCFNKKVIQSPAFRSFWENVDYIQKIETVIRLYETQFTSVLLKAGFKYSVFFDTVNLREIDYENIPTSHPELILKNKVPLLKIKSFISYPVPFSIIELIQDLKNYPVSLITDYFEKMFEPNTSILIYDRYISPSPSFQKGSLPQKIAVHLHVYYIEMLEQYIPRFNDWQFQFDLYITTDSPEKKEFIEEFIEKNFLNKRCVEIIITENIGRDILPWLSISDRLKKYDVVGHFHTLKSRFTKRWFGSIWLNELSHMLLIPADTIMNVFYKNSNVGIVIPDIPANFHYAPFKDREKIDYKLLDKLWNKMKCTKNIQFNRLAAFIMPYGNMFWYRPAALEALFNAALSADNFPKEPNPHGYTMLQCIQYIMVYIVWNSGYDFRIIKDNKPLYNGFVVNAVFSRHYSNLMKSNTYRAAKFIFFIPRKIRFFLTEFICKIRNPALKGK